MIGWRVAAPVVALGLSACAGFGAFVWVRTGEYPRGTIPAGQTWRQPDGSTAQVIGWRHSETIVDAQGKTNRAPTGVSYVLVEMRFEQVTEETNCRMNLSGTGKLRWQAQVLGLDLRKPQQCVDPGTGGERVTLSTYLVPTAMLDRVDGVQATHIMSIDQPPLMQLPG